MAFDLKERWSKRARATPEDNQIVQRLRSRSGDKEPNENANIFRSANNGCRHHCVDNELKEGLYIPGYEARLVPHRKTDYGICRDKGNHRQATKSEGRRYLRAA